MPLSHSTKEKLYQACQTYITHRIDNIQQRLDSIKESLKEETKSSVGDKHETGRAMMQLEVEKTQVQLSNALQTKSALYGIDLEASSPTVQKGSLILTNLANYYIAIGVGKVVVDDTVYYCVSQNSPIAKILIGKKAGEEINFNGKKIVLKQVQ